MITTSSNSNNDDDNDNDNDNNNSTIQEVIARAIPRLARSIWEYEQDYFLNCTTRGPMTN